MEEASRIIRDHLTPAKPLQRTPSMRAFGAFMSILSKSRHLVLIPTILIVWEVAARNGWINSNIIPAPSTTLRALIQLAQAGELWPDIEVSVARVVVGFGIAAVTAISLGLAFGIWPSIAAYILPIIELIRPISVLAWIPLAILWFGLGNHAAWFIIFLGSFFPIFTNTYLGVKSVAPIHLQVASCFGASRRLVLWRVIFPSALPYIMAGLRVGLGVGWSCVIAAELIAATSGLGYMIQMARTLIETEDVMAGMIVIGVIGFLMNACMYWLERRLTRWAPGQH